MNNNELFGDGFGVALATPFLPEGEIDEDGLVRLVQHVVRVICFGVHPH